MAEMKNCTSIEELLLIEARGKQKYFSVFDEILNDEDFHFDKRTRRPPKNEVNALMSFGNVFLYQRVATEIYKTALDIRIGFVHATNNRSQSLNLDIAEIFKPIIVDRAIFTAIHNREITRDRHFQNEENGGIYLDKEGKRIFIHELEHKLYQKVSVNGTSVTYDTLIRNEIKKIVRYVQSDEKYKAYKYT
jgi:CRISPR-associated endonuclease Cas1